MAGTTGRRIRRSACRALRTCGGSTPPRCAGAWLTTIIAGFRSLRTTSTVWMAAAMSRKVGRRTSRDRSARTMACARSSSAPAAVSMTIASICARTALNCRPQSSCPAAPTRSGPPPRRAFSTSMDEACGSVSATRVRMPRRWAASARWVATVVFPEPPLRAITAIVRMLLPQYPEQRPLTQKGDSCDRSLTAAPQLGSRSP